MILYGTEERLYGVTRSIILVFDLILDLVDGESMWKLYTQ